MKELAFFGASLYFMHEKLESPEEALATWTGFIGGRSWRTGPTPVDRHLKQLQKDGTLTKLAGGLYYCPKKTVFGSAPAEDRKLVEAFLKDRRYLLPRPTPIML